MKQIYVSLTQHSIIKKLAKREGTSMEKISAQLIASGLKAFKKPKK